MLERARAPGSRLNSRALLQIHGGRQPDAGQMVAVDPAAGASEDGKTDTDGPGGQMDPDWHLLPQGRERST